MSHFDAKQVLLDQLEKDETLAPRQKMLIRATLRFRPRKANEILGEVTYAAIAAGLVAEDGYTYTADPAGIDWSAIDWAELLKFIMQIIALFA